MSRSPPQENRRVAPDRILVPCRPPVNEHRAARLRQPAGLVEGAVCQRRFEVKKEVLPVGDVPFDDFQHQIAGFDRFSHAASIASRSKEVTASAAAGQPCRDFAVSQAARPRR